MVLRRIETGQHATNIEVSHGAGSYWLAFDLWRVWGQAAGMEPRIGLPAERASWRVLGCIPERFSQP
jgi:hypothetical protein